MREAADAEKIERLARELGRVVPPGTQMYLTGGATAVLEGWRDSTVDIDVRFDPDSDAALERIRDLKEDLAVNVGNMVDSGQVEPTKLRELFEAIEPELYLFPAVDPASLLNTVQSLEDLDATGS